MKSKAPLIVIVVILVLVGVHVVTDNETEDGTPPAATSADNAPPGSIHNLPVPDAVAAARAYGASAAGVGEGEVLILTAFERNWPDACLGLTSREEICAQVVTPGYEVTLQVKGEVQTYRTNGDGTIIRER